MPVIKTERSDADDNSDGGRFHHCPSYCFHNVDSILRSFGLYTEKFCSEATQRDAKAPTQLVKESSPHDKFFSSGLGYMGDMKTSDIEKEYMQYMTTTGGGYYHLNPLQLQAEISRIVDDKMTTGTQIQNKQRPRSSQKGYLKGAVDERTSRP